MKLLSFLLAGTMLFGASSLLAQSEVRVSVDFFHDSLDSYGDWREVGQYGYCWQPRDVDADWRPYSDGRWVYTDAGWTWDSEEPYSWAVYHYGRWARVDRIGWIWVPGTEWGPAWVSWRSNSSRIGWAPLPPDADFNRSVGFNAQVDAEYDIGPSNYNFVDVRNFGAPRLRTVLIEPGEDLVIFGQTTNVTRITYVNDVVYNDGPPYDVISRESTQAIPRFTLERRVGFDGAPGAASAEQLRPRVEGNSLRVTAIPFDTRPATAPRKVGAKVENATMDRGWNHAGPPAEVAKLRAKLKNDPAASSGSPESQPGTTAQAPIVSPAPKGKPPAKPANAEAGNPRPAPAASDETAPPAPSKQGKNEVIAVPRAPAEAPVEAPAPVRKKEIDNPARNPQPATEEAPRQKDHPGKGDAPPKPEPPAAPSIERNAPTKPEPRVESRKSEPHPKEAPVVTQPQPSPPAKDKGKGKGKDDKKDDGKPPAAPQ